MIEVLFRDLRMEIRDWGLEMADNLLADCLRAEGCP